MHLYNICIYSYKNRMHIHQYMNVSLKNSPFVLLITGFLTKIQDIFKISFSLRVIYNTAINNEYIENLMRCKNLNEIIFNCNIVNDITFFYFINCLSA